jgi:intraflagellar transport protein 140
MIRFWHLEADENYNLTVFDVLNADSVGINMAADKISSVVYDSRGRSLVAGTREGRLMFWKNMALGTDSPIDKDQWAPQPILSLGKQIQTLTVGRNNGVIVCKQNDGEVIIVSETKISARMFGNYKAILKGTDKIEVSY